MGARKGLSVGGKLAGGMLCLTLLTIALGGLALDRMSAMDDAAGAMRKNYLPSTLYAGLLALDVEDVRRNEVNLLASGSTDPAQRAIIADRINTAIAAVD